MTKCFGFLNTLWYMKVWFFISLISFMCSLIKYWGKNFLLNAMFYYKINAKIILQFSGKLLSIAIQFMKKILMKVDFENTSCFNSGLCTYQWVDFKLQTTIFWWCHKFELLLNSDSLFSIILNKNWLQLGVLLTLQTVSSDRLIKLLCFQ